MAMTDNEKAAIEETLKAFESYVIALARAAMNPGLPMDGLGTARTMLMNAAVDAVTVLADEHQRQEKESATL